MQTAKLLSFDEFRASSDLVAARHREHFSDPETADALLREGKVSEMGWPEWPDGRPVTA